MEFKPEEWAETTRSIIASSGDQAELTAIVTKASESVSELFKSYKTSSEENEKLKEENEKLKRYNMDLFERVTAQVLPESTQEQSNKSRAETITTKDLFKEEK